MRSFFLQAALAGVRDMMLVSLIMPTALWWNYAFYVGESHKASGHAAAIAAAVQRPQVRAILGQGHYNCMSYIRHVLFDSEQLYVLTFTAHDRRRNLYILWTNKRIFLMPMGLLSKQKRYSASQD